MKEPSKNEFILAVLQAHKELIMDAWEKWDPRKTEEGIANSGEAFRDYLLNYIDSIIKETET